MLLKRKLRGNPIYADPHVKEAFSLIDKAVVRIEVETHRADQYQEALIRNRKVQPRGRSLKVDGLPELGKGVFLTPSTIRTARMELQARTTQKEQEQAEKAIKASQRKLNTELRKAAIQERKEAVQIRKAERDEEKARKAARKTKARSLIRKPKGQKRQALKRKLAPKPKERISTPLPLFPNVEDGSPYPPSVTRRGRNVLLPSRFR